MALDICAAVGRTLFVLLRDMCDTKEQIQCLQVEFYCVGMCDERVRSDNTDKNSMLKWKISYVQIHTPNQ